MKWSAKPATGELLGVAQAELMQRGVPPFAKGEIVRALFVPLLPRTRPKSLPRDLLLIDAATVLAVGDED